MGFEDAVHGLAGHLKGDPIAIPTDPTYHHASHGGLRTLWVVFVLMVLAAISFTFLSWNVPVQRRVYHIITTIITLTAAVSYFAMATGHATAYACTTVKDSHKHKPDTYHDVCRQVFWVRYVDWSITTPLMILDLCLLAGVDGAHTLMAIVADIFMMLTGLFAAFGRRRSVQRWGWFIIACLSYVFVIWHVALHGTKAAKARGDRVSKLFGSLATYTLVLWVIYPIVWGIAGGSKKLSVDGEIITYAVLDILVKIVFGFWLLLATRKIPESITEINGYWSQGLSTEGRIRIGEEEGA